MSKLFKLIKIDLIQSYSINRLKKKHNQNRKMGTLVATLILGVFLLALVSFVFFLIASVCKATNQLDFLLVFGYAIGTVLCFSITISKANGMLFEAKDFELLMSMPINTRFIILSKLISLLILNYVGFGLIFIPCVIFYGIFASANIIFYLLALIAFVLGPLLIVSICGLVSYLLGLMLKKVKAKSIIMSIISLVIFIVIFGLYMVFVMQVSSIEETTGENWEQLINQYGELFGELKHNLCTYYPITKWLAEGLTGDILKYLLFVFVMVGPFSILVLFVGKNFLKANMNAKISFTSKNYKLVEQKQNSKLMSLLKRDIKRFFSSSAQVLNIGIGPILSTILLVIMAINFNNAFEKEGIEQDFIKSFMPIMLTLTVGFTYGIMPSTSSSINLEGKNFWILKSSPISTKDVFLAKVLFYVLICSPFIIINTIIMTLILDLIWYNILLVFVVQAMLVLVYSVEGLWINILNPKFDWDNEVKAIKQGTGPILSMLFGMLLGAIMYVPPFVLMSFGINGLFVLALNALIVLIIMCIVLFTHGKKRYEAIQI